MSRAAFSDVHALLVSPNGSSLHVSDCCFREGLLGAAAANAPVVDISGAELADFDEI